MRGASKEASNTRFSARLAVWMLLDAALIPVFHQRLYGIDDMVAPSLAHGHVCGLDAPIEPLESVRDALGLIGRECVADSVQQARHHDPLAQFVGPQLARKINRTIYPVLPFGRPTSAQVETDEAARVTVDPVVGPRLKPLHRNRVILHDDAALAQHRGDVDRFGVGPQRAALQVVGDDERAGEDFKQLAHPIGALVVRHDDDLHFPFASFHAK